MTDRAIRIRLAHDLTLAWLDNPRTHAGGEDVAAFLVSMHDTLGALGNVPPPTGSIDDRTKSHQPAVSIRKSLADPNAIISMLDGNKYKTLRRHLSSHGLTPEDYRERYSLPATYPMTAPAYSEARSALAKELGLGGKRRQRGAGEAVEGQSPSKRAKSISEAKRAAKAHLGSNGN